MHGHHQMKYREIKLIILLLKRGGGTQLQYQRHANVQVPS